MDKALPETRLLAELLLSGKQIKVLQTLLYEIYNDLELNSIVDFWQMDSEIGGIGGFCMPANPVYNPIPAGVGRELFRPLQYARAEIEITDLNITARHAVHESGMHLEAAAKYVLRKNLGLIGSLKINKITLGNAVREIENRKLLSSDATHPLSMFAKLYNKAKHEVNQLHERERLFVPSDALICYLAARKLGLMLLGPYYNEILLSLGEYIDRLSIEYIDWKAMKRR